MRSTSDPAWPPLAVATGGFVASLALFWPGVAMYDTVAQYGQALSGRYDDWHPPVMARLWALLASFGGGAGPMLGLQLAGYWTGVGLIGAALAGSGRPRSGLAVVAIGACPVFLGWQGVVLKDAQMVAAMLAATGIVATSRLRARAMPVAALVGVVLLLGYATLVRANAVFATMPLAAMLAMPRGGVAARLALAAAATLAVLAVAPAVHHRLLGASRSGVEKTQALYDLAGVAARIDDPVATGLDAGQVATLRARGCAKAFFWDPLGDAAHCEGVTAGLRALDAAPLYVILAKAAAANPIAYLAHRAAHWNSTERWLVPYRWPSAAPPSTSEPNTLGLGSPGAAAHVVQRIAAILVETPLGWPIAWTVLAATLLIGLARGVGPARDLAVALLASALALEGSFAAISIASDLRYHLWAMIATALAAVLAGGQADRRALRVGAVCMILVIVAAIGARVMLPVSPQSYAGMLG